MFVEAFDAFGRFLVGHAEGFEGVASKIQARQIRFSNDVAHIEIHEADRVLPIAGASEQFQMRKVASDHRCSPDRPIDVVHREDEDFGATGAGGFQNLFA